MDVLQSGSVKDPKTDSSIVHRARWNTSLYTDRSADDDPTTDPESERARDHSTRMVETDRSALDASETHAYKFYRSAGGCFYVTMRNSVEQMLNPC